MGSKQEREISKLTSQNNSKSILVIMINGPSLAICHKWHVHGHHPFSWIEHVEPKCFDISQNFVPFFFH
jgi:hypothetical protein